MLYRFGRRRAGLTLVGLVTPALLSASLGGLAAANQSVPPPGWIIAGGEPKDYDMGVDRTLLYGGKPSAFIKCKVAEPKSFGTLMQKVAADQYRGKRVRLSSFIKVEGVDWAGLWMRVDGKGAVMLAFDNMGERPIKGTVDWKKYDVVLDVAPEARAIAFGVLLSGKGRAFINSMSLNVVDASVAVTGSESVTEPRNLDFDK